MALNINSLQKGVASFSSGNNLSVTISAVTLAKSIIVWDYLSSSASPNDSSLRVEFSSTTQITFTLPGAIGTQTCQVRWQVIEFTSGSDVSVQHLTLTGITDGSTQSITAVDLANTFVLTSCTQGGTAWGGDDIAGADLTATTTITHRVDTGTVGFVNHQVVDMGDASVQKVSTLGSTGTTINKTISAVVLGRSFSVGQSEMSDSGNFTNLATSELTSTTNLQHVRTGTDSRDFYDYVVELPVGWITSFGTGTISSGNASAGITISVSDTANAFVLIGSASQLPSGRTAETGDNTADAFVNSNMTSTTNVNVTRYSSSTDVTIIKIWAIEEVGAVSGHPWFYNMKWGR